MKRFSTVAVSVFSVILLFGAAGCDKPSPEDCEKAIRNIEKLRGTDNAMTTAELQGEVRRCQGGSSREPVACAIKATTVDELKACSFKGKSKGTE